MEYPKKHHMAYTIFHRFFVDSLNKVKHSINFTFLYLKNKTTIMKFHLNLVILLITLFVYGSCQNNMSGGSSASLDTELDTISYSLGVSVANNLSSQGLDEVNASAFAKGVEDVFAEKDLSITPDMADQLLASYFTNLREREMEENQAAGKEFLAENKEKQNIMTTESGLQYEVLQEGTGASPDSSDRVQVHYTGKTIDGEVFDSSVERGEPATFRVDQVISGWTEGLQLMDVGSKYRFYIPSDLAYGQQGAGNRIPPNSVLIFDVELLDIVTENQ